jgi:hypothetical protein
MRLGDRFGALGLADRFIVELRAAIQFSYRQDAMDRLDQKKSPLNPWAGYLHRQLFVCVSLLPIGRVGWI